MNIDQIPSMGGREIGADLRRWAAECPDGTAIVELGAWLGAGTAQLAAGVRDSGRNVWVHAFDRFEATASEVEKAREAGSRLEIGQSTRGVVWKHLLAAGLWPRVCLHSIDIRKAKWPSPEITRPGGGAIALHVDDACKRGPAFLHALRTFGPSWIPGVTVVVLMDFWYFETPGTDEGLAFQYDWMGEHCECFEVLRARMPPTSAAAFRYLGGEPWLE